MLDSKDFQEKRAEIISKLNLIHGSIDQEVPEQFMSVMFIKPDDVVLEIGGNVGRNSCVIASLLNDSKNQVTVESCTEHAQRLAENRDNNGLHFNIENSAISSTKMYQIRDNTRQLCDIHPNDLHHWTEVKTITFPQLKEKYNLNFNTIVADCEGALYFILRDYPGILNGIDKVIIENDFENPAHKEYVDTMFTICGLKRVYVKGAECCRGRTDGLLCDWCNWCIFRDNFYEVWSK